jgi:hypothetical protein
MVLLDEWGNRINGHIYEFLGSVAGTKKRYIYEPIEECLSGSQSYSELQNHRRKKKKKKTDEE